MLSGARIVRIATHPDLPSQGYGSRALQQLHAYYEGKLVDLLETEPTRGRTRPRGGPRAATTTTTKPDGGLLGETIEARAALPPLLSPLGEKRPEKCHWIAAAFGLTQRLHKFWTRGVPARVPAANPERRHRRTQRGADSSAGLQTRRRTRRTRRRRDTRRQPRVAARLLRGLQAAVHVAARRAVQGYPPGPCSGGFGAPGGLRRRVARARMRRAPPCAARTATLSPRTTCGGWRSTHRAWWTTTWWRTSCRRWRARTSGGKSRRRCRMRKPPSCSRWACSTRRWTTPRASSGYPRRRSWRCSTRLCGKCHAALRAGKTREVEADMPKESALPNLNPHAVGLDEDLGDGCDLYASRVFRLASRVFRFSRHSRSLRSRLADAPGTTKCAATEVMDTTQDVDHQKSRPRAPPCIRGYKSADARDP